MKKTLQIFLLSVPLLYSLLKLREDAGFYILFCFLYSLFILFWLVFQNRDYYRFLLQTGVSYIFLDLSFHKVDFGVFLSSFRQIDLKYAALIVLTIFLSMFIRAYKWKYLLRPVKKVRTGSLFKTIIAGFMVNAIFPARLGEVYRAYMLSRLEKISKSTVFATVVLERVFDGLVIGLGLVFIFLLNVIRQKVFYRAGFLGIGFYVLAILLLLLFYYRKTALMRLGKKFLFFLSKPLKERIFSLLEMFYEGLHIFRHFPSLIIFIFFTFLTWAVVTVNTHFYLASMDLFRLLGNGVSPFLFSLLLTGILVIGISIPSGPGAVGPFQASILFCFFLINPDFIKAGTREYNLIASFSVYCWVSQVIIQTAAGAFVLAREKMKLKFS